MFRHMLPKYNMHMKSHLLSVMEWLALHGISILTHKAYSLDYFVILNGISGHRPMRNDWACFADRPGKFRIAAAVAVLVLTAFLTVGFAPPAEALPSFARQTGQPCGTCHTDFPALTPYGRRFQLL